MRPFVLLASRAEDIAADAEYQACLTFTGLEASQLHRIRMEAGPMPAITLNDYAGIIVGGSPFNSSDPVAQKSATQQRVEAELATLLDEVVDRDFPFLGACYGVGTLGKHQGAVIDRTFGEEIGPVDITLTAQGRRDPLLRGLPDTFAAYVGHKEAVRELPPHAVLLASSPLCPVQMFRMKTNLYATQFHPELDLAGIVTRIHIYRDYGYFPANEADIVIERAKSRDVFLPMQIMRNFVERYA